MRLLLSDTSTPPICARQTDDNDRSHFVDNIGSLERLPCQERESRRHIGPHRPSAALAAGSIDYFRDYEYLYLWVLHAQMDEYQRRGEIRRFNVRWANLRRTTSAILC